jgi:lipopolysaccharide transport system permease protein
MSSNVLLRKAVNNESLERERPRHVKVIRPPSVSLSRLFNDVATLVQYRDLLYTLTVHRIKVRYKQSVLGIFWAVLQPLALMLIYTAIFSWFARMPSDGSPYAVFVYTALVIWTSFSTALTNATHGLVSHSHLVTKVYFPREILPLTYVFAAVFDLAIASVLLLAMCIYYKVTLTINILYTIPIVIVLTLFTAGVSFILSAIQVRFRDIGVGIPLLLQIWMFASPVVYALTAVPAKWHSLYLLNPMAGIVENFRRAVINGTSPDFYSLGIAALVSVVLLPLSYLYFKHAEATVADII